MSMFRLAIDATIGALIGVLVRYVLHRTLDQAIDPLIDIFWRHAHDYINKHTQGHDTRSAFNCAECLPELLNLPE